MLHSKTDNQGPACPICLCSYDQRDRIPRIMLTCGHTFCSLCLRQLASKNIGIKCPLDKSIFNLQDKNIEILPVNFALKQILEERSKWEFCHIHNEEMRFYCLNDKSKVCDECIETGDHERHKLIPIKKIRAEVEEKIKKLKSTSESLDKYYNGLEEVYSLRKVGIIENVKKRFSEIHQTLKQKEEAMCHTIDRYFNQEVRNIRTESTSESHIKGETLNTLSELQTCVKEDNMEGMIKLITSQVKEAPMDVLNQRLHKINKNFDDGTYNFDKLIKTRSDQINEINFPLEIFNQEINNSRADLNPPDTSLSVLDKKKNSVSSFHEVFSLDVIDSSLIITVKDENTLSSIISNSQVLEKCKEIYNVQFTFRRIISMEELERSFQSFLNNFKKVETLKIIVADKDVEDGDIIYCFSLIIPLIENLKCLDVQLADCHSVNKGFVYIFNDVLPRTHKLNKLTMNFKNTTLSDKGLQVFNMRTLPQLNYLRSLGLLLSGTEITDESITSLFVNMERIQSFKLDFQSTKISDKSIEVFSQCILPFMDPLVGFEMGLGDTNVTDYSISQLSVKTENLKVFKLDLQSTKISDESLMALAKITLPYMKVLNIFDLNLCGTRITDEGLTKLCFKMETVTSFRLDLAGTEVTNLSLHNIIKNLLPNMKALKELDIGIINTRVSDERLIKQLKTFLRR